MILIVYVLILLETQKIMKKKIMLSVRSNDDINKNMFHLEHILFPLEANYMLFWNQCWWKQMFVVLVATTMSFVSILYYLLEGMLI
jgi:hypothetical protein